MEQIENSYEEQQAINNESLMIYLYWSIIIKEFVWGKGRKREREREVALSLIG